MSSIRGILQVKGTDIWAIQPDKTVFDALRIMADKDVGALLVMEDEKLLGILSERDYARKIILLGKASVDTPVKEIMTEEVFTVHPEQTIYECLEIMVDNHFRHLPVVQEGKVIGVISIGDVVNAIIHRQQKSIRELENQLTQKEPEDVRLLRD
ncbi:MAG: CBS domain-containing protein [Anaerolineaceae bacterium]|nr:CBS domain-containing protein [Anaerolineaceae bacterium]